jgi:hypothetical protein
MIRKPLSIVVALAAMTVAARAQAPDAQTVGATLKQYCVVCHNEKLRTAGMVIDPAAVGSASANPEHWEKVIQKLRSQSMPPAGMPRPKAAVYQQSASYLERSIDTNAAAHRNPGAMPHLHRLTRTEYKNAVRDLLAVDNLPKELEYEMLLPADNSASGFDNLSDLLFVSPVIMQRYLDAADKISRLAVGDMKMPELVNIHQMPLQTPQDIPQEGLPLGTRGGLAIHSWFPLDAEYTFTIETVGQARDQHELEVSIDGARVQLTPVGGGRGGGRGGAGRGGVAAGGGRAGVAPGGPAPGGRGAGRGGAPGVVADDGAFGANGLGNGGGGRGGGRPVEFRVPVKAGPHDVAITFIQKDEALEETTLRLSSRVRGALPAISTVTIRGPFNPTGPGDTPSRQRIFVCHPENEAAEPACAKKIISTLVRHAYRRPATAADLNDLMPFYEAGRKEAGFDKGIERTVNRLLVSPQFLYRIERDPANAAPGSVFRISDTELASRLSFFLWSSLPDDELLDLAAKGRLHDPVVLAHQTRRMLADERSDSMVNNFAAQWLFLNDVDKKDPDLFLFRYFDGVLRSAFERETELFVGSVFREDHSVLDLLTANYTYVNERLAEHYGIPGVRGSFFRKVTFPPDSPRGGLLGQGSILMLTSYPTRTSPVVRGKYVLENLLNSPPPPPPPNAANIPLKLEGDNDGKPLTMREAMAKHRASPSCAGCHASMDPIGFAMDNLDAVGQYRTLDAGVPIDASGSLPDGTKINGITDLKKALVRDPDRFVSALTTKLMMYALGRNVQYYDEPAIRAIVRKAAANQYKFGSIIEGIAESIPFQMRIKDAEKPAETTKRAALK